MASLSILDPEELRQTLGHEEPRAVYLLAGPDGYRAERTALWLRRKVVDENTRDFNAQVLYADETTPAAIAEAAAAYPMFGGRRFVWVRHAEALPAGPAVEPLLRYLASPSESSVLVLTSSKLDKRLRLTTACAQGGYVVDFSPLSGAGLLRQIRRQAKSHGMELGEEAAALLVDLVGDDLGEIDNELAKLSLLKEGGGAISPEEVRTLVARSRDLDAFSVADLLRADDPLPALRAWVRLRSGRGDVIGPAAILGWRLRQLTLLRSALEEGDRPNDAARRVGLAPWQSRRLLPVAESSRLEDLQRALERLREADLRAKSSRLGAELAYDLALLDWAIEGLRARGAAGPTRP